MLKNKAAFLLTVREVSELLRIQRSKVYDLVNDGVLEGFKLGADWRIKRASVESLMGPIPESFFVPSSNSAKSTKGSRPTSH